MKMKPILSLATLSALAAWYKKGKSKPKDTRATSAQGSKIVVTSGSEREEYDGLT